MRRINQDLLELQVRVEIRLPEVGAAKGYVTNKHLDSLSIAIRGGCSVSYRRFSPSFAPPAASRKEPQGCPSPREPARNTTNNLSKRIHVNAPAVDTRVFRELKRGLT